MCDSKMFGTAHKTALILSYNGWMLIYYKCLWPTSVNGKLQDLNYTYQSC